MTKRKDQVWPSGHNSKFGTAAKDQLNRLWAVAPSDMTPAEFALVLAFFDWLNQPEITSLVAQISLGIEGDENAIQTP